MNAIAAFAGELGVVEPFQGKKMSAVIDDRDDHRPGVLQRLGLGGGDDPLGSSQRQRRFFGQQVVV